MKRSEFEWATRQTLEGGEYEDALLGTPEERAKAAAYVLFLENQCRGRVATIIREYLREYEDTGYVIWDPAGG